MIREVETAKLLTITKHLSFNGNEKIQVWSTGGVALRGRNCRKLVANPANCDMSGRACRRERTFSEMSAARQGWGESYCCNLLDYNLGWNLMQTGRHGKLCPGEILFVE